MILKKTSMETDSPRYLTVAALLASQDRLAGIPDQLVRPAQTVLREYLESLGPKELKEFLAGKGILGRLVRRALKVSPEIRDRLDPKGRLDLREETEKTAEIQARRMALLTRTRATARSD